MRHKKLIEAVIFPIWLNQKLHNAPNFINSMSVRRFSLEVALQMFFSLFFLLQVLKNYHFSYTLNEENYRNLDVSSGDKFTNILKL